MKNIIPILLLVVLAACSEPQQQLSPTAWILSDVNVIDVLEGRILEHQDVVIDSGIIKSIGDSKSAAGNYNKVVPGSGKYLLPGLAEMHAHIPTPTTSRERLEETLFLYLSNGVTTIRGMLGHPAHLQLRDQVKQGALLSPRIFTSSPSLNGNTVPTTQAADSLVRAHSKAGYDFLKIHPGIPLEPFDRLVATANETGIRFAGHVPVAVGIRHALQSKYASIDHVDGFLEGLVPAEANVDPTENGFFGFNFTHLADTNNITPLVRMAHENQVWIVPTQSLFERWFSPADGDSLLAQAEMKYMPASTLENWRKSKEQYTGPDSGFDPVKWQQFINIRRQLMKSLQEDGHGMLLGSDAPQVMNVPGFSIHHEIECMVKAGLSPLQILQSGTINPARFFGMEDRFGSIAEGKEADLLLLDANPLEDLEALKALSGLAVRGQWIDRAAIETKLEEIARHAKNQ